jgi:hypothetical protein
LSNSTELLVCPFPVVELHNGNLLYCVLQVYQIGGYDGDYNYLNYTFVYDPTTKEWSRTTDMPTARGDHMCANFMGEIYSLGGYYVSSHVFLIKKSLMCPG